MIARAIIIALALITLFGCSGGSRSEVAGVDPAAPGAHMTRPHRHALLETLKGMGLPIDGDRGWTTAEVTAGGVPLAELRLETLESHVQPGLHLCGEICDVDGRIGGFNFQWAWATGTLAARGAAQYLKLR